MDLFLNPKILHESCHILSQYGATKTLRPFLPMIMGLTYDLKYCYISITNLLDILTDICFFNHLSKLQIFLGFLTKRSSIPYLYLVQILSHFHPWTAILVFSLDPLPAVPYRSLSLTAGEAASSIAGDPLSVLQLGSIRVKIIFALKRHLVGLILSLFLPYTLWCPLHLPGVVLIDLLILVDMVEDVLELEAVLDVPGLLKHIPGLVDVPEFSKMSQASSKMSLVSSTKSNMRS